MTVRVQNTPTRSARFALGVAVVVGFVGVGAALAWKRLGVDALATGSRGAATEDRAASAKAPEARALVGAAHPAVSDTPSAAPSVPAGTHGAGVPPEGINAAQWQSLRDQLRDHPQRDAELARISATMAYLSRVERYRALRASGAGNVPAAQELASTLLGGLPERVASGEVSAGEARRLQAALFDTLSSTPADRDADRARLDAAVPTVADLPASTERDARFQREASAVLAAWNALPPAQRSSEQLEAMLDTLRRSVFGNPEPAPAGVTPGVSR